MDKSIMNNAELKKKVCAGISHVLRSKKYLSTVDVLLEIGVLATKDCENWRFGRVPYVEKVCKVNLHKLSFIIKEIRAYAKRNCLKPSNTVYKQWGVKGKKILLRFSKSGNLHQEEVYSTHYVVNIKKDSNGASLCNESITDFKLVPKEKRTEFIEKNRDLIYRAFYVPIGKILSFYPEAPCYWLVKDFIGDDKDINQDIEFERLNKCIIRLLSPKDLRTGHIRAVPLNRAFKHGQMKYSSTLRIVGLLPKYPIYCTEEEKYYVQQHARTTLNIIYQTTERYKNTEWLKYFWRRNLDLVPCKLHQISRFKGTELTEQKLMDINERLRENVKNVIEYLNSSAMNYKYDLYSPERDEILLGLLSRITRLYAIVASDLELWAKDTAGINSRHRNYLFILTTKRY